MKIYGKTLVFILTVFLFAVFGPTKKTEAGEKNLSVYYPNWAANSSGHQRQKVVDLPWDRLSVINHSFWIIQPNADRTEFPVAPADRNTDLKPGGCFDQYAQMLEHYPDVKVVIAVGGWGGAWFSDMAITDNGRKSFVDSCVQTLLDYPWLGGIDIDWEYPGTSRNWDEARYHGRKEDMETFVLLMKELREAFNAAGLYDKLLTFCTISSVNSLRSGSAAYDFMAVEPYIDRVNIMTYDMAGGWSNNAMHHAALHPGPYVGSGAAASAVVEYLLSLGVPPMKINIGTPLYCKGWTVSAQSGETALGKSAKSGITEPLWYEAKKLETSDGWEVCYDEVSQAAYLFNSDPDSPRYRQFYTYENERSLQAKIDYINETGIAGIIVWATSGDSVAGGYPMLSQMAIGLGIYAGGGTYVKPDVLTANDKNANPVSEWAKGYGYKPGDVVFYGNRVFRALNAMAMDMVDYPSTVSENWELVGNTEDYKNLGINFPQWSDDVQWYFGAVVFYSDKYYIAINDVPINGGMEPGVNNGRYWREYPKTDEAPGTDTMDESVSEPAAADDTADKILNVTPGGADNNVVIILIIAVVIIIAGAAAFLLVKKRRK